MNKYDFRKLCQEIERDYEQVVKQEKGFTDEEKTLSDIIDLTQSTLDTALSLVNNRICLADKAKIIDYSNRTIRLALTIKHEK